MPGFLGLVSHQGEAEVAGKLATMLAQMWSEPFYQGTSYYADSLHAGVAAVIQRGASASEQPYWNASKDIALFFAGELFSIADNDRTPVGAQDLLELYQEVGRAFVEQLNGIFCGALLDLRERRLLLFNDRYGLGRIYYHQCPDGLYFASEAKALLAVLPQTRKLDYEGLAQQFSVGCTMENRTLFEGLSLLPPASLWQLSDNGQLTRGTYFQPETWEAQSALDDESYYQALKACFAKVLPRYFAGDRPIAMSLTGGLDGRMMIAYASRQKELPCYTFGGSYRDCADVKLAREAAKVRGYSHQVLAVGDNFLGDFPNLAQSCVSISDGTMDVGGAVELYVNRLAREIAPVRLTGNYGSEILRRNVAFRPARTLPGFVDDDFAREIGHAAETYHAHLRCHPLSFIAFKQVPWHHYARLSVEQSQLTVRSPYLDNELVQLAYRAPATAATSAQPALRLINDGDAALARIPTDRGLVLSPKPVLTKLHHSWQKTTVRAEYAYDYGMPPWLARIDRWLRPLRPERLFLGRHKFYHFRVWYRDQLAPFVRDVLLDGRTLSRDYLSATAVRQLVEEHISGKANHTLAIHRLLTTELTQRQLLESFSAS